MLFPPNSGQAANAASAETLVLFLDDSKQRHIAFLRFLENFENVRCVRTYTAEEAIRELNERKFDQVFLDHDLSEEDIMVMPYGNSVVPTGMHVVDHILSMDQPPQDIVIHSCNIPAALAMFNRLQGSGRIESVRQVVFPNLIQSAWRWDSKGPISLTE